MPRPVYFVDTGAWLARWDQSDAWHEMVDRIIRELVDREANLLTTDVVLLEFMVLARRRKVSLPQIGERLQAIEKSSQVVCTVDVDFGLATRIFLRYAAIEFSGVDASSIAVMERLGVDRILTVDEQFIKYARFVDVRPNLPERRVVLGV